MKKWSALLVLLIGLVLLNSCQKETSFEGTGTPATGSLRADGSNECLPKSVMGTYEVGTALSETNYIDVTLDVTGAGSYVISSDTVNGFYFRSVGIFTSTGQKTVRLRGIGTPIEAGTHSFIVSFDSSSCVVQVVTLPEGAGGPAAFTYDGAPNTCTNVNVLGTYTQGVALTSDNTVALSVNVTTIGTYDITTETVNGIAFTGAGTFGSLGPATILLSGNGTPLAGGNTNIPTPGTSVCTFSVPVLSPAEFTIDCAGAAVAGNYRIGEPLGNTNTIIVTANVTTPGGYSITTVANNGMVFTANGEFTALGAQPLTFIGSGTPAAEGTFDITIATTTRSCTVPVVVTTGAAVTGEWEFTSGGITHRGEFLDAVKFDTTINGVSLSDISYAGSNTALDNFFIEIVDIDGTVNSGEQYVSYFPALPLNFCQFGWATLDGSGLIGTTFGDNTTLLTVRITLLNPTTRRIEGTFTGTGKDQDDNLVTITNGRFTGNYVQ